MNKIPEAQLTSHQLTKILNLVGENPRTNKIMLYDNIFVEKTIVKQIQINKIANPDDYFQLLKKSQAEQYSLIEALKIGYTDFFRNPLTFAILEQLVIPALANKSILNHKKEIRIWSAACATGQEVYSLAILLEELKEQTTLDFSYRIFATDISAGMLERAEAGLYKESDTGNLTVKRLRRWFKKDREDQFLVSPGLKKHIEFSQFDLLSKQHSCPPTSIFGDFDLVFCANLLFYYKNEVRNRILGKLMGCLNAAGYLVCGEAEREILKKFGMKELIPPAPIFKLNNAQY